MHARHFYGRSQQVMGYSLSTQCAFFMRSGTVSTFVTQLLRDAIGNPSVLISCLVSILKSVGILFDIFENLTVLFKITFAQGLVR